MNKQKGFSLLVIILIIVGVVAIATGGGMLIYQHYNPANPVLKPAVCTPNWQCSWGACANGSQSQIAVDSNNCGLLSSGAKIACPALARLCTAQPSTCTSINYSDWSVCSANGTRYKTIISALPIGCNTSAAVLSGPCTPSTSAQPSITVTSPNGGERWVQGSTHNITWRATGVNNVRIFIADFQTGLNIEHTIANVPASSGLYSWTIPSDNNYLPIGNSYKIMISEYGGPTEVFAVLTGASNNSFTITAPANDLSSITVTSPNGGEVWKIGETKNITWQVNRVSMVDISVKDMTGKIYSIDQGIKSSGSFSWFVGRYYGGYLFSPGQYKIEIKNTYAGAGTPPDISNNYFTVADAEFVNGVCGPVNGTKVLVSPDTGLCYSGIASSVSGKDNLLSWLCYGTGGGVTVSCSASYGLR